MWHLIYKAVKINLWVIMMCQVYYPAIKKSSNKYKKNWLIRVKQQVETADRIYITQHHDKNSNSTENVLQVAALQRSDIDKEIISKNRLMEEMWCDALLSKEMWKKSVADYPKYRARMGTISIGGGD